MEPGSEKTIESQQSEVPATKSGRFPVLLVPFLSLFILLIGGTYFIYGHFRLPGEKFLTNTSSLPTSTPTSYPSSVGTLPKWHAPKNYLATDANGNILLGSLKDGQAKIIVKTYVGNFGTPQFKALSKFGKYFLYIKLPDAIIADLQKNPPYEYHGSNDYELHLVTLDENGNSKDEIADTNVAVFLGPSIFAFDKDEKGFYYPKYENEKDVTYYFSIADSAKKPSSLPLYLDSQAALSPTGSQYVFLEALSKNQSDTSVNSHYNLNLYSFNNIKKKILYPDFISGENSLIFPTENAVYLAREDYVDGPNSICYIEKITVPDGIITPIRAQECPPGFSNTNYHDLKLSPDGKLLLAIYSQEGPGDQANLGSFFVYDMESEDTQIISETESLYGNYFWINNREIITTTQLFGDPAQKATTYRVNLTTGEASPDEVLSGKTILGVY